MSKAKNTNSVPTENNNEEVLKTQNNVDGEEIITETDQNVKDGENNVEKETNNNDEVNNQNTDKMNEETNTDTDPKKVKYVSVREKVWVDLQDNKHPYKKGDIFPREGLEVSEERLEELSTTNNKIGEILIKKVEE